MGLFRRKAWLERAREKRKEELRLEALRLLNCEGCQDVVECMKWQGEYLPVFDVSFVVRCAVCQAWDHKATTYAKRCAIHGHATKPMDFCSYGERRQDNAAGTD